MSLADIASDFGAALGVPEPTAQTTYHVAVEPVESTSPTSAFLVAVSADTAPTAGVVRTEKDFELLQSALQTANHDKAFKFGLPKLPPRPRSLFRAGGKSAEQERAAALQAHLAELVTHPEVVQIAAFQAFISAAAAAPAAAPEPGSPPVRAREGSGALGSTEKWKLPAAIVRAASRHPGADKKASTSVKLTWTDAEGEEKSAELPILEPTEGMGNRVIDVRSLAAKTGFFTHDPGFTSTSSCESCITFIDGDKGVLLHRGYAISDLAANCTFPEVAFLLMEGELPDASHLDDFTKELGSHAMVHEKLIGFYQGFKSDAHPMAIMVRAIMARKFGAILGAIRRNSLTPRPYSQVGVVGALSAFYPDSVNIHDADQRRLSAVRLVAKMPTIAAIAHKTAVGQPVVYPNTQLGFAANFLHMMFATPCAWDASRAWSLTRAVPHHPPHAPPSTSGARRTSSTRCTRARSRRSSSSTPTTSRTRARRRCGSRRRRRRTRSRAWRRGSRRCGAPPTAAPTRRRYGCSPRSDRSALGPRTDGTRRSTAHPRTTHPAPPSPQVDAIPDFLARAKDKADPTRLMGFGHRVYKNYDPRAKLMAKVCKEVLESEGVTDCPELAIAQRLEQARNSAAILAQFWRNSAQ